LTPGVHSAKHELKEFSLDFIARQKPFVDKGTGEAAN
jgi:hypothetical protein